MVNIFSQVLGVNSLHILLGCKTVISLKVSCNRTMGSASVHFICGGSFIELCWKSEFVGLFI